MTNNGLGRRIAILWLAVLVIGGGLYLFTLPKTITWNASSKVPAIFSTVAPYGPDSLVLSNGRQFVQYNYKTGQAKALSGDSLTEGLSNIDSLTASPDGKYLAFHQQLAPVGSVLNSQLTSQGLSPSGQYWWVYDVSKGSFYNFPASVNSVQLSDTVAYALSDNDTGQDNITPYTLSNFQAGAAISMPESAAFSLTKGGFLLLAGGESQNGLYYTTNGIVNKQLAPAANKILYSNTSNTSALITLSVNGGVSQLATIDAASGTQHVIAPAVSQAVADSNGDALVTAKSTNSNQPPQISIYDASAKKVKRLKFANDNLEQPGITLMTLLDSQTVLLTDPNGTLYLAGAAAAAVKQPSPDYDKTVRVGGNTIDLQYYPDQTAFIVTLDQGAAEQERDAIYKQLSSDGLNPVLLDIRFTVFQRPTQFQ